jgi:serine/threonine-protein kinase
MSAPAPAPLGVIAHYNLLERLEPAGPGDLFRARDTRLGRTVVLRLLPRDFAGDARGRASFIAKARSLVAVSHPNVTTVFDVAEDDGRLYVVFEFIKGQSLRSEMAGRPMNVRRAVELAIQIADAVSDAHAGGFVHGGLSPESVVVTAKGHAKIPAFELAARTGFDVTSTDVRLHDYDSPEEAQGQPVDDRSDIYSVGAVLYEMLTTRRPQHRGASAPSASNPDVPGELDVVVLKAVAPNPNSRFQSAATLAAELRSILAIMDVRGIPGEEGDELHRPPTSVARVLILAAVILLGVGLLAWWLAS